MLGPTGCLAEPEAMGPYATDWRGIFKGRPLCVLRPSTVREVGDVVLFCRDNQIAIVPQGGNTGLTGAATPDGSGTQVVLSTGRLRRIRNVDAADMSIIAEAGATVLEVQSAAADSGALFPLSFAAEGSATIGGAIATNAGGTSAVRYGGARDLVLGLEVVLPDGTVWNGLRTLRKDNTGYSLRHLFAGSEGTLGIITAAAVRLVPKSRACEVAMCSLRTEEDVSKFWEMLRLECGDCVRAVEYMSGASLRMVAEDMRLRPPLAVAGHFVLVELSSNDSDLSLRERLERALGAAIEGDIVIDAAIAQSVQQRATFWRLREDQGEAQRRAGINMKHDVAVPVSRVGELLVRCRAEIERRFPGLLVLPFGHLGDGNIHMNVIRPHSAGAPSSSEANDVAAIVYDIVGSLGGTFSAEHGIGVAKLEYLERRRSEPELHLMRQIKRALDPANLMNPGKVLKLG
ncbi:FAD-binding oxidoreductase [Bradyrhizobium sp. RDI18]|uniref:FAD-binding oxidoreductase n=1 Tax=Bradyrhizobium sp. RDI18 TaxID=3367400 RepID=UPI00372369B1